MHSESSSWLVHEAKKDSSRSCIAATKTYLNLVMFSVRLWIMSFVYCSTTSVISRSLGVSIFSRCFAWQKSTRSEVNGKAKGRAYGPTPSQRRSVMARVVKGPHSFTCHLRVYPRMEWTTPAFAFTAEAGPHLPPRRDGRLSWPKNHHDE